MANDEYRRKRALIKTWEERERADFRKKVKKKAFSAGLDLSGASDLVEAALDADSHGKND